MAPTKVARALGYRGRRALWHIYQGNKNNWPRIKKGLDTLGLGDVKDGVFKRQVATWNEGELDLSGKGFLTMQNPYARHIVAFEDGVIYDSSKKKEMPFALWRKTYGDTWRLERTWNIDEH
jgi:hypothetical protein